MSESLSRLFRRAAERWADAPAVLTEPVWSYRRLDQTSDAVAAGLQRNGVEPGERVALLCPNGPEFVVAYLGILKAGTIVVPINLLLNPAAVAFQLRDCGCRTLMAHLAMAETARAALADAPGVQLRIGIGGDLGCNEPDVDELEKLDAHAPRPNALVMEAMVAESAATPEIKRSWSDDAVILYTSGTTGRPKGAVLTHGNLAANVQAVAEVLALEPGRDRFLVVLPMFHAFAATVGLLTPLLTGAALIPVPRFDPQLIVEGIAKHRATIFLGVPSLYTLLLRLPEEQIAAWSSVRLCISGGAAMPQAVMEQFEQRFGVPILEGDGPTECGPVTAVNPPAGPRQPASIGPPIPGVEMRICDADGNELPNGEHGEVCVRGPSVMRGYWNLPEATAESFFGDWFRTGDLGRRDDAGWFYLVDRIKDLIITNGMNVYPRIVEEALMRYPGVAEAAVVGEPHPAHGEIVIAHLVALPGQTIDVGNLKRWCREHLGRHEQPRRIELRDSMPKNAAGKILKRELRLSGEHERGFAFS
ncbi:MAG: long-chain fatty acid--CoA ligase [Halochromatium sp.]|nr:long-chain fatty acid--CoA ligase [Halochromatium sp.]